MNPIGIYYAYWTHNWNVDFHPFVDRVAALGFDILEVNAGTVARMSCDERQGLKAHADNKNIRLSYCMGLPAQYDLAAADMATRQRGVNFLCQTARAIGEMGGGPLGGIIYGAWPAALPPGETDKRPYLDHSIESMKQAVRAAEDNNVTLNLEVVNRFEQYLLNTCDEAVAYVDAVGSPNCKVMLDTFHMNIEEDLAVAAIAKAGKKLGHFHIGENNRMPPGYGHIPWTEIANALCRINYNGYVVMEPFLMPGGKVGRDIKVFRDLSVNLNLDEEARKALEFLRGVLK